MGTVSTILLNLLIVLLAVGGGIYQLYLKPFFAIAGISPARTIHALNNEHCKRIELEGCEELVLHQPSGLVYLACAASLSSRVHWNPAMDALNATGASTADFVAIYDPFTSSITRLTTSDFNNGRGLSVHGMDVVASEQNPEHLYIYLVNHRIPVGDKPAHEVGADSVVEIFETTVGSASMHHVKTVADNSVIITPNSVAGSPDGKSFYVTNDHSQRTGFARQFDLYGRKASFVGYCHVEEGCKPALPKTYSTNGITAASNGTVYVASPVIGAVDILEQQADNTLVVTDSIKTGYFVDNLAVDAEGHLWGAAVPIIKTAIEFMKNPTEVRAPTVALMFSINTGPNAFFGEKYKIEKMFEDDGNIMSGATSASYDSERNKLYLTGITSPYAVVCDL